MVSVSHESTSETDVRLCDVIGRAEIVVMPGLWSLFESPRDHPPTLDDSVLAVVRDETTWSALRPNNEAPGAVEVFMATGVAQQISCRMRSR